MYIFSKPKWHFANFILYLNDDKSSKSWKINITTETWKLKSTDQFDSRRGPKKMHLKGTHFAQVINHVKFPFLGHLSDTIW